MLDLVERLKSKGGGMEIYLNANTEIINEALEKEKEQIINAHVLGWSDGFDLRENKQSRLATEYYNETYNQKIPEILYKDGTPIRKIELCKEAQELLDEAIKDLIKTNNI